MRRAAKTDHNQARIVDALRNIGVTVKSLHTVGQGCPDLLCAIAGHNFLIEVKAEKGKLTEDQIEFHQAWNSIIHVVTNVNDALMIAIKYKKLKKLMEQIIGEKI